MKTLREVYGCLDNIVIVTLAPELENSDSVIRELTSMGIVVSLGKHESKQNSSYNLLDLVLQK